MTIVSKVERISSKKAERMLNENHKNQRPVSVSRVDQLAGRMLRDEFKNNGQPIVVDEDGAVIDGQHRLLAVIAANTVKPYILVVVVTRGVSRDSFDTMDQGSPRSVADILVTQGITHRYKMKASVSTMVANHLAGKRFDVSADPRVRRSPKEIADLCSKKDSTIAEAVNFVMYFGEKPWKRLGVASAKVAFCYWLGIQENKEATERVITYLATGTGDNHKLLSSLRNWLFDQVTDSRETREKNTWLQQRQVAAIMLAIQRLGENTRATNFGSMWKKEFNGTKRNWKYTFA